MSLENNKIYAMILKEKYGYNVFTENLDGSEETLYDVTRKILSKDGLLKWLRNEKREIKELRQYFNMEPYDKFDIDYDKAIREVVE